MNKSAAAKKLNITTDELNKLEKELHEVDDYSPYYKLSPINYEPWYVNYLNRFKEALEVNNIKHFRRVI